MGQAFSVSLISCLLASSQIILSVLCACLSGMHTSDKYPSMNVFDNDILSQQNNLALKRRQTIAQHEKEEKKSDC